MDDNMDEFPKRRTEMGNQSPVTEESNLAHRQWTSSLKTLSNVFSSLLFSYNSPNSFQFNSFLEVVVEFGFIAFSGCAFRLFYTVIIMFYISFCALDNYPNNVSFGYWMFHWKGFLFYQKAS